MRPLVWPWRFHLTSDTLFVPFRRTSWYEESYKETELDNWGCFPGYFLKKNYVSLWIFLLKSSFEVWIPQIITVIRHPFSTGKYKLLYHFTVLILKENIRWIVWWHFHVDSLFGQPLLTNTQCFKHHGAWNSCLKWIDICPWLSSSCRWAL